MDWAKLLDCALNFIPYVGSIKGLNDCYNNVTKHIEDYDERKILIASADCMMNAWGMINPYVGYLWSTLSCMASMNGRESAWEGILNAASTIPQFLAPAARRTNVEPSFVTYY